MRVYWTSKSIPELRGLNRKQRGRLWWRCYWKAYRHWQTWAGLIACGALAGLGVGIGQVVGIGRIVGGAIGGGLGGFIFSQVLMETIRPHLREERERIENSAE